MPVANPIQVKMRTYQFQLQPTTSVRINRKVRIRIHRKMMTMTMMTKKKTIQTVKMIIMKNRQRMMCNRIVWHQRKVVLMWVRLLEHFSVKLSNWIESKHRRKMKNTRYGKACERKRRNRKKWHLQSARKRESTRQTFPTFTSLNSFVLLALGRQPHRKVRTAWAIVKKKVEGHHRNVSRWNENPKSHNIRPKVIQTMKTKGEEFGVR